MFCVCVCCFGFVFGFFGRFFVWLVFYSLLGQKKLRKLKHKLLKTQFKFQIGFTAFHCAQICTAASCRFTTSDSE